mgnify:CR=1 FL=1
MLAGKRLVSSIPLWALTCAVSAQVTDVKGEWLVELAPHYYDLNNFPKCEARTVLERVYTKKAHEAKN